MLQSGMRGGREISPPLACQILCEAAGGAGGLGEVGFAVCLKCPAVGEPSSSSQATAVVHCLIGMKGVVAWKQPSRREATQMLRGSTLAGRPTG